MQVSSFRYPVDGWGVGELAVADSLIVAHELPRSDRGLPEEGLAAAEPAPDAAAGRGRSCGRSRFAHASGPPPPRGDTSPPEVTLAAKRARVCVGSVSDSAPVPGPGRGQADLAAYGRAASAPLAPDEHGNGDPESTAGAELVADVVARVRRQLAGQPVDYADLPLDLSWCTPFQAELAAALRAVPWGEVVSYGELAALAGRPGAARAAGTFCANNAFALIVPCHRVVGASGIGGYGSAGLALKRRLLALEGVHM